VDSKTQIYAQAAPKLRYSFFSYFPIEVVCGDTSIVKMGVRSLDLKKWTKFLKAKGLVYQYTNGGHEYWDLPNDSLSRPVTFSCHHKEIVIQVIASNLYTMGLLMKDLEEWPGRK